MPYPPTNGGRTDVWSRLNAFKKHGVELQLICWQSSRYQPMSAEQTQVLKTIVADLHVCNINFDIKSLLRRLWNLRKYSSQVASRVLIGKRFFEVVDYVKDFGSEAVWLDTIYGGVLAQKLCATLKIPLFTRSQNIEHYYFKQLIAAEQNLFNKLKLYLTTLHLKKYEFEILRGSKCFFDISMDDLNWWRSKGVSNGYWLPPFVLNGDAYKQCAVDESDVKYDIAFLGNLNTPNNVEGIKWLITDVLPLLLKSKPNIKLAIGGSNPTAVIENICYGNINIDLIQNPQNAFEFYSNATVLVNPILKGSGVKIKTVEMLFTDKDIVTTKIGVEGLPEDVRKCYYIADDATDMANNLLLCIERSGKSFVDRSMARKYFDPDAVEKVIKTINSFL